MAEIINGKARSLELELEISTEVSTLVSAGVEPCLAVILVGDDPASRVYVKNKMLACGRVGIKSVQIDLPADTSEAQVIDKIIGLNCDNSVHGILVQLPVPPHINKTAIVNAISPLKDVDCFVPQNVGLVGKSNANFLPCTPAGVIDLIKTTGHAISGCDCVVIGRSDIVGKPLAALLTAENATVTLCHSKTKDLGFYARHADILVSAVGRAGFVTADLVKKGAIVIDVGMNRNSDGRLVGDVDFEPVSNVAGYITPVPGGVGPMTIAKLLENTVRAAKLSVDKQ